MMGTRLAPVVALALAHSPVAIGADLPISKLLGCWVMVHEDPGITEHDELCFANGSVESMRTLTDEGLGTAGPFAFDGTMLSVRDKYAFPDGWLFKSERATCRVSIVANALTLGDCMGDDDGPYAMTFVRSVN